MEQNHDFGVDLMLKYAAIGNTCILDWMEDYVKEGDKVIASKYAGTMVKLDGEEYTIVSQSDILAKVE